MRLNDIDIFKDMSDLCSELGISDCEFEIIHSFAYIEVLMDRMRKSAKHDVMKEWLSSKIQEF